MMVKSGGWHRRLPVVAVVVALAAGFAACGDSDDDQAGAGAAQQQDTSTAATQSPQQEAAGDAYLAFIAAVRAESPEKVCASVTPSVKRRLGGAKCEQQLTALFQRGDPEKAKTSVVAVDVNGGKAVVKSKTGTREESVPMTKMNGIWKVNGGVG